ncbi:MAG: penicillin acylase family protein, partial [Gemmatimonadota bacterium]
GGSPVQRTFEYTEHNGVLSPVVARKEGKAYVVSTPYMHQAGLSDEQSYRMTLAKDIGEFREAMKLLGTEPQNIMAGDAHGNTFYVRMGRTPIRPSGFDWTKPVPGNTSKTAWKGIHPFEDLVQIENPPQGYMQNNNLAPDRMMEESPLTADRYPSYIFNDTPGRTRYRGIRAVELLSNAFSATVEDAIDIALDEKWVGTEAWKRALRRALNQNTDTVRAKPLAFHRFVQRILNFDGFARASSVAALNYYYWLTTLPSVSGLSEAQLEDLTNAIETGKELAPEQNRWLLERIERAIEAMIAAHGTTNVRCGDVFRVGRGGDSWPAGCGYFSAGKHSAHALRILGFRPPDSIGQRWLFRGHRNSTLTIFTDPIQSFTLAAFGQSDHPDSPHYSDQARLVSESRFKPTYFYKEDLLKHVVSTKTLDVRFE